MTLVSEPVSPFAFLTSRLDRFVPRDLEPRRAHLEPGPHDGVVADDERARERERGREERF